MILNVKSIESYFKWYWNSGTWRTTTWRGVEARKVVSDMWNYQEIISSLPITLVIECGARKGGSTLFFADLLTGLQRDWRILSIDIVDAWDAKVNYERITKLVADSGGEEAKNAMKTAINQTKGKVFAILDSDHTKKHVLRELETMNSLLREGDYLLVEDTCINGHPINERFGPGPYEAVEEFIAKNPESFIRDVKREKKFGFTCAPMGFWIKN